MKLSADFAASEMACKCGKCGLDGTTMDKDFITKLQELRTRCGFPFKILSGLRCPDHNLAVGGAIYSAHLAGRAADVEAKTSFDLFRLLMHGTQIFTGIGIGDGYVHFDNRLAPAMWTYYKKEAK